MASAQDIQTIRFEMADTDPALPLMSDQEYGYFIDKHAGSIRRAMLDAARALLFKLSYRTDQTVDIFSIKGSKAAENYRLALQTFLKDPNLNPALYLSGVYAGGISKSDMQENDATLDNNAITTPALPISDIQLEPSPFNL